MRLIRSDAISPAINAMASPWKIGSARMTARADDNGQGGQQHRTKAHRAGIHDRFVQRHAFLEPLLDEIDQDDGVAHDDARAGHEANHRRGGEKCAQHPCAGRMPTSENGIAAMTMSGVRKERNQPTIRDVDQHQHRRERRAEIAKDFDGDMPFAVPFHRRCRSVNGWVSVVDFERRAVPPNSRVSSARSALFIFRIA